MYGCCISGEVILAESKCVIKYSLFSDQKKGLNGSLFCTNFRVAYVTSVETGDDQVSKAGWSADPGGQGAYLGDRVWVHGDGARI